MNEYHPADPDSPAIGSDDSICNCSKIQPPPTVKTVRLGVNIFVEDPDPAPWYAKVAVVLAVLTAAVLFAWIGVGPEWLGGLSVCGA